MKDFEKPTIYKNVPTHTTDHTVVNSPIKSALLCVNPYLKTELDHVDCECIDEQDKRIKQVSGFMAGRAFNDICKMIGGRWPDARLQEEAPEAYAFFMKIFYDT